MYFSVNTSYKIQMKKKMISLVVPCYNEAEALPHFMNEVYKVISNMEETWFEIILVNDGSKDNTLQVMKEYAEKDARVKYVSFSRNFGKESAMYAGLKSAAGEYVALLDADLQDPPSLLPQMYDAVENEGYDSAATRRVTRKGEPPVRSFFARLFYKVINAMTNVEIVDGARDFRFMNRKYVNALLSMAEVNRFSKGLFGWVGFRTKWIEFENVERVAGETKWSFWKLFKYSVEGIVAFTTMPLLLPIWMGFFMCLAGVVGILLSLVGDINVVVLIMACLILLAGIQLMMLGIIGQYLSKMYLEIKQRPIYILDETNI